MRHHLDPQRTRTPLAVAPGPSPTRADDADPAYVAPRVLGFASVDVQDCRAREAEPLLWDGDQA